MHVLHVQSLYRYTYASCCCIDRCARSRNRLCECIRLTNILIARSVCSADGGCRATIGFIIRVRAGLLITISHRRILIINRTHWTSVLINYSSVVFYLSYSIRIIIGVRITTSMTIRLRIVV